MSPLKRMFKAQPLVPVNVALFGNRVFADVIKLRQVILDWGGSNLTCLVSLSEDEVKMWGEEAM